MTPAQLRTLIAVAETGSVHAAAERLVVTASAVSASLNALQGSLKLRLTTRDGRGIRLTEAGQVYVGYAYRVLGLLEEARSAAAGETDPERGAVRIGAVTSAGDHILPTLLIAFRDRHPEVGVSLEVDNQEGVTAMFARHEVDLVIGARAGNLGVAVGVRPNELVVVAPARLAVQAAAEPDLGWLRRQTWLLRERGSNTRQSTLALLSTLQLSPRTLTMGSDTACRQGVMLGLGVTLVSRDAVANELDAGWLAEVPTPATPVQRPWYMLAHRGRLPATPTLLVRCALETGTFQPVRLGPGRLESEEPPASA